MALYRLRTSGRRGCTERFGMLSLRAGSEFVRC
jgi:hypothetical protein